jgi:hypothetical protein
MLEHGSSQASRFKLIALSLAAALAALTLVAHLPALQGGFLTWDDEVYVTENPNIQSFDPAMFQWALTSYDRHNWHPLTWVSHATDYAIFGADPWGHHLVSVLIHCFNALWVFALGLLLLGLIARWDESEGWRGEGKIDDHSRHRITFAAFFAGLLFGIHPQHVESVAWIAERKDVLFLFFLLPSLLAYLWYAIERQATRRRIGYALSLLCGALAIASKPMAVSLPLILLILDVYPLRRTRLTPSQHLPRPGLREHLMLVLEKLPFFALSALSCLMTLLAQWNIMAPAVTRSIGLRMLNAADAIAAYIWTWAYPFGLSPYYPYRPDYKGLLASTPDYALAITLIALASLVTIVLWVRRQHMWLTMWTFYLVTLIPVLGLVSVGAQSHADRYSYMSTLPLHLLAGGFASLLVLGRRLPAVARAGGGVLLVALVATLVITSREQARIWQSDITVWQRAAARYPTEFHVQTGLGHAYLEAKEYQKSAEHYTLALEFVGSSRSSPFASAVRLTFAGVLIRVGELDRSSQALAMIGRGPDPADRARVHGILARKYCMDGQTGPAQREVEHALRLASGSPMLRRLHNRLELRGCPQEF